MKIQLPPPPYSYKGFSCFVRKNNPAFTLAEVLITLTIIGVIAALTVPNLINKVQDHGYRSAFLKVYNTIQNAHIQAIRDGYPFWEQNVLESKYISPYYKQNPDKIKDYFKIAKGPLQYEGGGGIATIGAFYLGKMTLTHATNAKLFKCLNGNSCGDFLDNGNAFSFQLVDGAIISFCNAPGNRGIIFIDANGPNKPNTFGRDIFLMQTRLVQGQYPYKIYPFGSPYTTAGNNKFEENKVEDMPSDCKYSGKGKTCAYEIVKNRAYVIPES